MHNDHLFFYASFNPSPNIKVHFLRANRDLSIYYELCGKQTACFESSSFNIQIYSKLYNSPSVEVKRLRASVQKHLPWRWLHSRYSLTCGRITFTMFFRAVSGDGGEQSGVGPVELLLWWPVPGAVIATSEALSARKNRTSMNWVSLPRKTWNYLLWIWAEILT